MKILADVTSKMTHQLTAESVWTTCSVSVPDVQTRLPRCLKMASVEKAVPLRGGKEPESYNTGNSATDTITVCKEKLFCLNVLMHVNLHVGER